jgi:hypothetical protein
MTKNLSLGENVILFSIRDNILLKTKTATISVNAYDFLSINEVYANVNNVTTTETTVGNMVRFIAQGFDGGSNNQTGQWYLNGQIQNGETSTIMDRTFNQAGTYNATYERIDNVLENASNENLSVEKSTQIEVYDNLSISEIITNPVSPITVNTTTNFNINPTSGSDAYTYLWNYNGYTSTSKSFNLNLDYNYYGTKIVSCTVTDTNTNISITATKSITVNGAPTLTAKQTTIQVFNDNDVEYNAKIGITFLNGSGQYSYQWTVDGQSGGTQDNANVYITCSDQSDIVTCIVTDTVTGRTKTVTKTYTFSGNCGGGVDNPREDDNPE